MAVSCFMRRAIRFCASFSQPFLPPEIADPPRPRPRQPPLRRAGGHCPANAAPAVQVVGEAMSECGLIDIGVSGTCVITVQRWLNRLDNAALTVNGLYGPATQAAVVTFQRAHGLAPDGQVDEQTKQMLRSLYAGYLAVTCGHSAGL